MSYKFLILLLLPLVYCSDSSYQNNIDADSVTIKININQFQREKNFQSIISITDTLVLEESDSTLIGEIDKVFCGDKYIFVSDRKKTHRVYMYRKDGSFVRFIGKSGIGVGEYLSPDAFCVDAKKNEIIILDKNSRAFLFYNFNGEFIRILKYDGFINSFSFYGVDRLIIDSGNIPDGTTHCLVVIDENTGEIVNKLLPKSVKLQNMPFMSLYPLEIYNGEVIYQPSMSNLVYSICKDSLRLKYKIDFGKLWPELKDIEQLNDQDPTLLFEKLKGNYVLFPSLIETSDLIFICFSYKDNLYVAFKSKNTKSFLKLFLWNMNDDISLPIGFVDKQLVSVKYRYSLSPILLFYTIK